MADSPFLDAAKRQLSITNDMDNALLNDLIAAAIDHVERETGLVLAQREVVEEVTPGRTIRLRSWPITTVTAVHYRDRDDAEQTLGTTFYRADLVRRPATLNVFAGAPWPARCSSLTVTLTAGYADVTQAPATIQQAIMVLVAEFYTNREAGALSESATRSLGWLLRGHRVRML